MSPDDAIGAWMKRRRKALDLTQKDLADLVGCSTATIHKIERGERRPSRQVAALIAKTLEIPADEQGEFIKIARGEPALAVGAVAIPPIPPLSHIPIPSTSIIGRETEIQEIERLICHEKSRLVSIIGEGGMGKSRLALEIARRFESLNTSCEEAPFPDGILFVPLVSLSSPELIIPAIADNLGFNFYKSGDQQQQLIGYLREKRLLIILDNFEHLVQGSNILAELLASAAGVQMIVTSRERLNLLGEWVLLLKSLPYPPIGASLGAPISEENLQGTTAQQIPLEDYSAVIMFAQCARRRDASFTLNEENKPSVVEICRLVNGIPLALELAASWINTLSPAEIADEIQKDASFLAATTRDIPERHRSIRAVFDHSWDLLSEPQRKVFQQLSVFRGSFTRQAAEIVADASLDTLSNLLEKSLLNRTDSIYFELHELLRQYASTKLNADTQNSVQINTRHCIYYLDLLSRLELDLRSRRKKAVLGELTSQVDDIRQAWMWAVSHDRLNDLIKSANGLLYYYDSRNLLPEGQKMFSDALSVLQSLQDQLEASKQPTAARDRNAYEITLAQILAGSAYFDIRLSRISLGISKLQESIRLLTKQAQENLLADAYWYLATGYTSEGNYHEATRAVRESIVLNRRLGRRWQEAMAGFTLGVVMTQLGSHQEAHRQLEEVLRIGRDLEDPRIIILAISTLSQVKLLIGLPEEALHLLEEGYQIALDAGDYYGMTLALSAMAEAARALKDYQTAQELYQRSIDLYRNIGDVGGISRTLIQYGGCELEMNDPEKAQVFFTEALQTAHRVGALPATMEALVGLARVKYDSGDAGYAILILAQVLEHPSTNQPTRERASQLIAEFEASHPGENLPREQKIPASLENMIADLTSG